MNAEIYEQDSNRMVTERLIFTVSESDLQILHRLILIISIPSYFNGLNVAFAKN
jgi:hypothetical protein